MYVNLHGYLPTKCEPGNVVVDFEIAVLTTPLKQSNMSLYLLYTNTESMPIYKFRHIDNMHHYIYW